MSRSTFIVVSSSLALLIVCSGGAWAHERYNDGCNACHGAFNGPVSPMGTTFPSNDKHIMHRANQNMAAECDLCHSQGDENDPFIGSSDGTQNNVGVGCVGCHGREEDAGNDGTTSPGRGAGLRQHHTNAGVNDCGLCHPDALPANYTPVDENVLPQYYGTADTLVDEPCNLVAASDTNENWSVGDFVGSDNDGDLIYDGAELVACPEPGSSLLLSSGVGVLVLLGRRRGR